MQWWWLFAGSVLVGCVDGGGKDDDTASDTGSAGTPVAVDDQAAVDEGGTVTVDVAINDQGDPGTVSVVDAPKVGAATANADGTVTYVHDGSETTSDSFTYTIGNGSGATSNVATVQITIAAVDDPPVAVDDTETVDEGGSITIDVWANDTDSDSTIDNVSVVVVARPTNGTAVADGVGGILYTHDGGETTSDSFTYTIDDLGGNTSNVATVTMVVNPVDDPPVAVADALTVDEGGTGTVDVVANDFDIDDSVDPSSVVIVSSPASGTATVDAYGVVTYTHDGSEYPTDSFDYQVRDLAGEAATARVTVTVTPVNDPPVADDDSVRVNQGQAVTIDVIRNDMDVDDGLDVTSVQIVTNPTSGALVVNADGTVDYTHDDSATTSDQFEYTVQDLSGATSNVATVSVTIGDGSTPNGLLYAIREADDVLVSIDPDTQAFADVGALGVTFAFGDMTWDESTQTLFMVDGRGARSLYTIDVQTGAATLVGAHNVVDLFAIEVDDTGTLWGVSNNNVIYTLDKVTGAATATGSNASQADQLSLAWDSTRSEMLAIHYTGTIYSIDMGTGVMVDLGNPTPQWIDNNGTAYDPFHDIVWALGWSGTLMAYDPQNGYAQTSLVSNLGNHDGMAWVPAQPVFVGQYDVIDGPHWGTSPVTYTCQEACALLFGGAAGTYECSTDQATIDNMAWGDTYGVSCGMHPEDFKVGQFYDSYGQVSAYVNDNCVYNYQPTINYCFQR